MKQVIKKVKNNINDMDKPLLMVTVIFFIFGLLNIVTASSREAVVRYDTSLYHYFWSQLMMLGIGTVGSLIIINTESKHYKWIAPILYFIILGIIISLSLFGEEHKGAINWITLFGFTFQPSEFAKPILIVFLAVLYETFARKLKNKRINHYDMISIILLVSFLIPVIVFFQKDFGTMFITCVVVGTMFLASPIIRTEKVKTIGLLILLLFCGCCLLLAKKGYIFNEAQMARFDFFNPCSDYETGGYQVCNGFIALNDGGLFGLGIGKSKQKYSYIPEPHTDSVFAIVGEEIGLLWSTLIFIAYIFILKRILNLASIANTTRGKFICLGVATYIFMHILVNLGGLFGIMPLTGVPLPFLSYGGSFTISLIASLAIVQRIHIETKNQKIRIK